MDGQDEDEDEEDEEMPADELFDEASGRWFALPHPMDEPRRSTTAVLLPAAALAPPPGGAPAAQ